MEAGGDAKLHRFRPVFAAPGVRGADPKQLFRRVRESWQSLFRLVSPDPLFVRQVGFLYSAVVRDVFALSVYAVELLQKKEVVLIIHSFANGVEQFEYLSTA